MIWENHMIQKNIRNMVRFVFSFFNSQQMNFTTNCSSIFSYIQLCVGEGVLWVIIYSIIGKSNNKQL